MDAQRRKVQQSTPFRKPWRLQRDGVLWEQVLKVVIKRGATNQDLRKVKGHPPKEDVEAGTILAADQEGNDKSDVNADEGVEKIKGKGLVVIEKWIAESHDQYKKLMEIIHKMIAVITLAGSREGQSRQDPKYLVGVRSQSLDGNGSPNTRYRPEESNVQQDSPTAAGEGGAQAQSLQPAVH